MDTEKIIRIKRSEPDTVFNLSVLNDESYLASGIIVHNCRSALIPATSKTLKNEDLLIENRDFTQHYNQDFKPLKTRSDIETVNQVLDDIGKFNEKYRIDQFILDEDIQLRLMKLKLDISPNLLETKKVLDDWLKPEPEDNP